ncbi:polyprenyl synthetase family protein [Chloroflexota bacterium]
MLIIQSLPLTWIRLLLRLIQTSRSWRDKPIKLPLFFERYRSAIDAELKAVLSQLQLPLYDMMRYHLGWINEHGHHLPSASGKALRPTLCLLACEASGGTYTTALPGAVAIELVHNSSLIHDDIQDEDKERRHRPTVWSIWGKPQAINTGMAMRTLANLAIRRLGIQDVAIQKQILAQSILDEASLRLNEGQFLDLSYENHIDAGVMDYLDMIEKKTAALIQCSVQMGALLGTDDETVIARFRTFGNNLGLAFQIRDDVLGIWGNDRKTGKPVGMDIQRRKKSLPIVFALEKAPEEMRKELLNIYRKETVTAIDEGTVLEVLEAVNAHLYAQEMAWEFHDRAIAEIKELGLSPSAEHELQEVAHFVAQRDF